MVINMINETEIEILPTFQGNVHLAGFPGWDHPEYRRWLDKPEIGMRGRITGRNSHGMAPFTRYNLILDNGDKAFNAVEGTDFRVVRS